MVDRRTIGLSLMFGLFIVSLLTVTFVPAIYDASQADATTFGEYQEGGTDVLTDGLVLSNIIVPNQQEVNVSLRDTVNANTSSQTISEGDTATFQFEQGNVSVTIETILDGSTLTLTATYPPTFGFTDSQRVLSQVIPVLVAIIMLFLYAGFVAGVFLK